MSKEKNIREAFEEWFENSTLDGVEPKTSEFEIWKAGVNWGAKNDSKAINVLNSMRLSMKAHPGYQTGRNQEFVDYVERAESILEQAGKI